MAQLSKALKARPVLHVGLPAGAPLVREEGVVHTVDDLPVPPGDDGAAGRGHVVGAHRAAHVAAGEVAAVELHDHLGAHTEA